MTPGDSLFTPTGQRWIVVCATLVLKTPRPGIYVFLVRPHADISAVIYAFKHWDDLLSCEYVPECEQSIVGNVLKVGSEMRAIHAHGKGGPSNINALLVTMRDSDGNFIAMQRWQLALQSLRTRNSGKPPHLWIEATEAQF